MTDRKLLPTLVLVLLLVPGLVAADASPAEPAVADPMAPMASMTDWVGTWKGEASIRMGPGDPMRADSLEVVESVAGGDAILVRGLHHDRETGEVVHDAVALLSWDEKAGEYLFRTQVAGRGPGDFRGHMDGDDFVWGGPNGQGGEMRYTIDIQGDRWHEVGEFSTDGGETWRQFFEMTLQRVSGSD